MVRSPIPLPVPVPDLLPAELRDRAAVMGLRVTRMDTGRWALIDVGHGWMVTPGLFDERSVEWALDVAESRRAT